jgi:hypothetical protein
VIAGLLTAALLAQAPTPDGGALAALATPPEPAIGRTLASEILFLPEEKGVPACDQGAEREQILCLLRARYVKDPAAQKLAVELYEKTGTVAGQLPAQPFDGGYRGQLRLVPRLTIGPLRLHLQWAAAALHDYDLFFQKLGGTPNYRWRALDFRFFESVKRRTPSAFAVDWSVAYNVAGSLFGSEAGVRSTLFHEVFHLNDQAHGNWSRRALGKLFDGIVTKCGTKIDCLTPYVADSIKVKGGTYYAFQPGNGVGEYAADLARRYYLEQRAVMRGEKGPRPFKCGPEENRKAWALLVEEFFGGVDLVPACLLR